MTDRIYSKRTVNAAVATVLIAALLCSVFGFFFCRSLVLFSQPYAAAFSESALFSRTVSSYIKTVTEISDAHRTHLEQQTDIQNKSDYFDIAKLYTTALFYEYTQLLEKAPETVKRIGFDSAVIEGCYTYSEYRRALEIWYDRYSSMPEEAVTAEGTAFFRKPTVSFIDEDKGYIFRNFSFFNPSDIVSSYNINNFTGWSEALSNICSKISEMIDSEYTEASFTSESISAYFDRLKSQISTDTEDYYSDIAENGFEGNRTVKFIYYDKAQSITITNIAGSDGNPDFSLNTVPTGAIVLTQSASDIDYSEYLATSQFDDLAATGAFCLRLDSKGEHGCSIRNNTADLLAGADGFSYADYEESVIERFNGSKQYLYLVWDASFGQDKLSTYSKAFSRAAESRYAVIVAFFLSAIVLCISAVYILMAAGKRKAKDEVGLTVLDRLWSDLHIIISAGLAVGCFFAFKTAYITYIKAVTDGISEIPSGALIIIICAFAFYVLFESAVYFIRQLNLGTLFSRSFICFFCTKAKLILKKSNSLAAGSKSSGKTGRVIFNIICFVVINIAFAVAMGFALRRGLALFFLILTADLVFNAAVIFYAVNIAHGINVIFDAIKKISEGNYFASIDFSVLPDAVKDAASYVELAREGMKDAVDEAVSGERTKAELITNVSHDLKTPLTSIINYVDLLRLELKAKKISDEKIEEYITVLDNKSARLKNLIEDLTEASKVTSGNLKVDLQPLDLRQLAIQVAGENEDRFEEKELELVFSDNGEAVPVTADPGHTWRIIDNVFSNVLKYSKPGTRVYVSVDNVLRETADGSFVKRGAVTIKNISAKKLGIPVAELMRRFVRGDESRSGEGSGLGLSIAAGLAQIQGGVFYVDIDGDLFKSVLELDSFENKDSANT